VWPGVARGRGDGKRPLDGVWTGVAGGDSSTQFLGVPRMKMRASFIKYCRTPTVCKQLARA
jgi:hypothetical protein